MDNESYLVLAIKHQLQSLVKCLCEKGVDLGTPDTSGNVPLWVALRSKQENIASMLVRTYVCAQSDVTQFALRVYSACIVTYMHHILSRDLCTYIKICTYVRTYVCNK